MEATMDLSALLETPSWDVRTVQQIGLAAFESGKHVDQFKSWVSRVAQQDDRQANLKAGIGLFLLGRYDAAVDQLKQAGDGPLKRYYLGLALRERGEYDAALTELERAGERGGDGLDVTLQRVETLQKAGRLDEAEKLLNRAAKSSDGSADFHYHRGCVQERNGLVGEAIDSFGRAMDLDPDHRGACFRLAYLNDVSGSDGAAVDLYRRCVQLPPAPVNALINLAILYEDQGNYDRAIRCLQEVLSVDPNDPRAKLYLKDALAGLTQYYDEIQERARDKRTAVLDIPITDFELSVRSRNCLKRMNIHTLGDLLRVSEEELLSYKNFGETSLSEIKAVLTQKGLRLGQGAEEERGEVRRPAARSPGGELDMLNRSVDELELSVRARRCLERLGLRSLGDLSSRTEAELMAAKNFGSTSLMEIKQKLAAYGLSLRQLEE